MRRLLIDLTDLELWRGTYGGTQRVVYGIAKNFFAQADSLDYEVQFMVFSGADKSFRKTGFAQIYERAESQKTASLATAAGPSLSRKSRLKNQLQPYVPEAVRRSPAARKVALKTLSAALKVSRKARRFTSTKMKMVPTPKHGERINFQADDIVLVLGKPWDNLDIQRLLSKEKHRVHFKLIELVYDMIIPLHPELHHPDLFTPYTQHMFEAIASSDLLLSISRSTARDVKTFCTKLNLDCPEIKTIRLGDEVEVINQAATKPDTQIANEFIACVGTIEIRKNHNLLYYAYKYAGQQGIDLPQLVIVGSRGWLSGDFQYLVSHDLEVKGKIIILDGVSDAGLNWIYNNSLFTVYPSFYEGWGLPVAESLAQGKPCLASNSSSIPEIGGQLVDYFSPYDPKACLDLIGEYLDKSLLKRKAEAIKETYKVTSWEQTFNQVCQAIAKLTN